MIAMLRGRLEEKQPDHILIDVGGVGYRVFIALSTYENLPEPGQEIKILTLTHVREDAFHLYGFSNQAEKTLFILLNNVNGIGAKLALAALSTLSPDSLASAISAEDITTICRIPGIGRKTAQRLIIELKDRLPPGLQASGLQAGLQNVGNEAHSNQETAGTVHNTPTQGSSAALLRQEISSALLNLGYKRADVEWALRQILNQKKTDGSGSSEPVTTLGVGLRAALKLLSRTANA